MAEIRKRSLPTPALLSLNRLFRAIPTSSSTLQDEALNNLVSLERKQVETFAYKKIRVIEYKLSVLSKKLEKIKAEQDNFNKLFDSLRILKEDPEIADKSIIEIIEIIAQKKQKRSGAIAQINIELQILSLKAAVAFLKNINGK